MVKKDYSKKNKRKRKPSFILNPKILTLIILVFIIFSFFPLIKNYNQKRLVDREVAEIQEKIKEFETKNQDLKELFTYLESDSGRQEIARLNLGLKSPDEEVVIIENLLNSSSQVESDKLAQSNWQKWLFYFFKN
jgi:cell division protein FtsL